MEKNRRFKLIIIILLVVAICGLSLGFSFFSNSLSISPSATVTPDSDTFKVLFSSSAIEQIAGSIDGVAVGGATAGSATINNDDIPTISNLTAGFTAPGQSVSYSFYVRNTGEYEAFLRNVSFKNVVGESSKKVCTARDVSNTTASSVELACASISITIDVGSTQFSDSSDVVDHSLARGDYEAVTVTITYATNGSKADGDFIAEFGGISLLYKSNDI